MSFDRRLDPSKFDDISGVTDQVIRLRCEGKSKLYISKAVGISLPRVNKILEAEFRERFAGREELRQRTALELDYVMRPFMERLTSTAANGLPDRHAAEIVLKTIESRKRLFALDEPVRVDVKHTVEDMTDDQLARELAIHGVEYRQLPPAADPPQIPVNLEPVEDAEIVERSVDEDQGGSLPTSGASYLDSEGDDG